MAPKVVGVAWYRPRDWNRLREIAADPEALDDSHRKWLASANRALRQIERGGLSARKVIVDLDELQAFCKEHQLPITTASRARFVAEKIRQEEQQQPEDR